MERFSSTGVHVLLSGSKLNNLSGIVGSFIANITAPLLVWLKVALIQHPILKNKNNFQVDDAVGATCVHGFGEIWRVSNFNP